MSTVVYGELDPSSGDFTFCAAGHPPPLLETDGAVEVLETGRSPLLAVGATGPRPTATVRLQPGATLVLYTDGLVERRGETFDLGIRRLERALRATVDLDPEARCEAILERLLDGIEQDDDVALLCVRRSGATRGRFSSRVRPEPSELGGLRHRIGSWLREHHLEEEDVASVVLAVNEAVANAIEHGGRGSVDVLVDATMDEGALTIEIRDQGRWQNRPSEPDRGRGLLLMQALMDEVDVERSSSGTLVRMRWGSADGPDDRYGVAHRGRG
jgi:anti-sigma regulatory factor (Ser/Thr protein kinase)